MYNVAFFFHILGVLLFVSGIVVAGVAFEAARRRQRSAEVALLLGLTRVGVVLVAVGGVLAGVFGLWLVHRAIGGPVRCGWSQRRFCMWSRWCWAVWEGAGPMRRGCWPAVSPAITRL